MQEDPRYYLIWTGLVGLFTRYVRRSFMDFFEKKRECHIVRLRMYYKPTKFNQKRWAIFWENWYFFVLWTTLNFRSRGKTNKSYGHTAHPFFRLISNVLIWERFISISYVFQMTDNNTFLVVSPANLMTSQQK